MKAGEPSHAWLLAAAEERKLIFSPGRKKIASTKGPGVNRQWLCLVHEHLSLILR